MRRYISDEIGVETYGTWLVGKKVIINAPTGTGKTTFVLKELLPYCKSRGKKMLILCNRRLLKIQYGYDLAEQYGRYEELIEGVDVMTYQALTAYLTNYSEMQRLLNGYDILVCDEVHFFYADADFNGLGTYVLLQALVKACFFKTMLMITATLDEVLPLLVKTFRDCEAKLLREKGDFPGFREYCWDNQILDFGGYCNYDRFTGVFVQDEETLVQELLESNKKTLIFIDDKNKAEILKETFKKRGKLECKDVFVLTSEILETRPNDAVVKALAITHQVLPRILITTSVLDNGVSIHDRDVGNVVIATESKVSFLQMLGRVRAENVEECKLYIFPRTVEYYEKRIQQYEEKTQIFDKLSEINLNVYSDELLQKGWHGNDEKSDFLRKALIINKDSLEYYGAECASVEMKRGDGVLAVNAFAKEKVGNMLLAEKRFYKLAMRDAAQVAVEQISWIGKTSDELSVIASSYIKERKKSLKKELLEIKEFTQNELSEKKEEISKKYRKDVLADLVAKNGSFSKEKFEKICNRFGLCLEVTKDDDKKNRYTVKEEKEDEENKIV